MQLFRSQVLERQRQRLYGEVRLDSPLSAWALTVLIGMIVAGLVALLIFGSFARKETVTGWLVPDKGVVRLAAPEAAVIDAVYVALGDEVRAGDAILTLRADAGLLGGGLTTDELLAQLALEEGEVERQISLVSDRAGKERAELAERRERLLAERGHLDEQIADQAKRVALAARTAARYDGLTDAASPMEIARAEEALLALRQEGAVLEQRREGLISEAETLTAAILRSPLDEEAALSELRGRLATLRQRRTEYERRAGAVLRSPVAGTVSALSVRVGEPVPAGLSIATVLPEGGVLEAELFIPTRAAGFVREGQEVRLQLDAFPHQKFGHVPGRVGAVAATVSQPRELPVALPGETSVYRSTVVLQRQAVEAYGQSFPLQPGMAVQADIIQEKKKLWEIVLDPLLAKI